VTATSETNSKNADDVQGKEESTQDVASPTVLVGPLTPNTTRNKPDWDEWRCRPQGSVAEAVALSCDVAPDQVDFLNEFEAPDLRQFYKRLRIADENVKAGTLPYVNWYPDELAYDIFRTVRLGVFANWAEGLSWELPKAFPRPEKKGKPAVDWTVWGHRPQAELWEVVAVSLDIAPDSLTDSMRGGAFDLCPSWRSHPQEFLDRLAIAEAHLGKGLNVVEIVEKKRRKHFSTVSLADFAAWFVGLDPPLPPPLPKKFPKPAPSEQPHTGSSWPWGTYETEALKQLAAAVREFWMKYDPAKPRTAPTNDKVKEWLKSRGVADRTAEVMATIIRPDALPPGPRPI